jgi:hypothetical protein
MRSALLIFFLLVAAFMQGMTKIDAQAAHQARVQINQQVQGQR